MLKKLGITFAALAVLIGGVVWFINGRDVQQSNKNEKFSVVTTNSILQDMVEQVGGDDVDVYSMVPRGTDPHEYEPKPEDIRATTGADVIFHNGLNLETGGNGWFTKLMETANKRDGEEVFSASEHVEPMHLTSEGKENEEDPHAWLDIQNGIKYVEQITSVLKKKDAKNADAYQERADKYIAELNKLDTEAKAKFNDVPEAQRVLVTSEGAFKYFSKAYGITPVFIWEINTESQGTPEQMKQVLSKIDDSEVKSLFVESSVSPKSMEKVVKETGLPIYSTVFTDSLAKEGENGDTYYAMMKWNIDHMHDGMMGKTK
ncbi:metal ABC transporter solute-binding protein, Zn/Mn family [Weissella tructae]|uniref:SsaB protein n=2 Tax=Weissella TaxID=46255 RepID=A0A075U7B5_9LACO|nr:MULTISPECIES: zinc ABC transporter substrate-binding protein [Weissella]AIG65987.1 SsaB protein [Weissella tructae]AIM63367.1 SsaB protein [Weissella ceti]AIM64701.1 SsaB protein [Weissella ceti]ELA07358.1 manganese ABC transporter substrate binding component [Weissella ceti NC36]QVV91142.1 zinc ABC transporter substrate-binding protein [Weissella tructae]